MPSRSLCVNTFPHPMQVAEPHRFRRLQPAHPAKPADVATYEVRKERSAIARQRTLSATLYRLSGTLGVHADQLVSLSNSELWTEANRLPAGRNKRRGRARRLVAKIVRLRSC